jgi:hypothetical protein
MNSMSASCRKTKGTAHLQIRSQNETETEGNLNEDLSRSAEACVNLYLRLSVKRGYFYPALTRSKTLTQNFEIRGG